MKTELSIKETVAMFEYVARQVIQAEPILTEIDKKIGDGDHGIGMSEGFREVRQVLAGREFTSINEVFQVVGTTLLDTMGGASGVLFGTVFISGLIGEKIFNSASTETFANFFEKSLAALKRRGRAKVGDKTMVDALEPAVNSLVESRNNQVPLSQALQLAEQQAFAGKEFTKQCLARFGRAKSYKEKALGLEDAGSVSVWIIFKSIAAWVNGSAES